MKPLTAEWAEKAEGDFGTASREAVASPKPNYDNAVFHAQQCVEKYLKARLIESAIPFRRTHDLEALLALVLPMEPAWKALQPTLNALTSLGIDVRYPGASASAADASWALQTASQVRQKVRASMGLV